MHPIHIKLIPLIDFQLPFIEIKDALPEAKLSVAEKDVGDFLIQEISKESINAVSLLKALSSYLRSKHEKNKLGRKELYVIITDKKVIYRGKPVLGLSEFNGNSIVSTYLIQKEIDMDKEDEVVKVILHEIGHGLGLKHCKTKECIMSRLEDVEDLRRQRLDFCNDCKSKIKKKEEKK